ncbi:2-aminoethylphosphonate--pyruvate transaminase [Diplonema papillatum]|nr:2-aminoethylphosphonate--pyruvate transaminase [Diplonema papillatum]|eukprot:gene16231-24877_t
MRAARQSRTLFASARTLQAPYKDKQGGILFTPGPLSTTRRVKEKMLVDYGSRDTSFIAAVQKVREGVLRAAELSPEDYTAIPMQGSGSMGVEAILGTMIPPGGKLLILRNGSYGDRINNICKRLGIETVFHNGEEDSPIDLKAVETLLQKHGDVSMVAVVHCETSTGVFNPVEEIGALVQKLTPNALYFVDAMSSFAGKTLNIPKANIDVLVSSSNKCVQGLPGFSIVIARKRALESCSTYARSYTLDLCMQEKGLSASGQFNNTPPVQVIMAFAEALQELEDEGGIAAREQRYLQNQQNILTGMQRLGFETYLDSTKPSFGHIISAFKYPAHEKWDFKLFYDKLNDKGFVIYPGKAAKADCFRIGHIGDIQPEDSEALIAAISEVLAEMGITIAK